MTSDLWEQDVRDRRVMEDRARARGATTPHVWRNHVRGMTYVALDLGHLCDLWCHDDRVDSWDPDGWVRVPDDETMRIHGAHGTHEDVTAGVAAARWGTHGHFTTMVGPRGDHTPPLTPPPGRR